MLKMNPFFLIVVCCFLTQSHADNEKRLLLHDDQDFVAEFVKLRATVVDLQTENQQLKTKQLQVETELERLKSTSNGGYIFNIWHTEDIVFNIKLC